MSSAETGVDGAGDQLAGGGGVVPRRVTSRARRSCWRRGWESRWLGGRAGGGGRGKERAYGERGEGRKSLRGRGEDVTGMRVSWG